MKFRMFLFLAAASCCIIGCNNGTDDMDNESDIETTIPHTDSLNSELTTPTPHITDSGRRTTEGTSQDSIKSTANPLYKGDNTDTGSRPRR